MDEEMKLQFAFELQELTRSEGEDDSGPIFIAKGFAAVSNIDTDLIEITREALTGAIEDLKEYRTILYNHHRDCPVGSLWADPELKRSEKGDWGIYVEARVSNNAQGTPASGKQVQEWIADKTIQHFSIQGDAKIEEVWSKKHSAHIRRVKALKAHEISFVTVPGNVMADVLEFEIRRGETLGSSLARQLGTDEGEDMPKGLDLKDVSEIDIATAKQFALQIVGEEGDGKLKRELDMLFDKIERDEGSEDVSDMTKKVLLLLSKAKDGKPEQLAAAVGVAINLLSRSAPGDGSGDEVDRMIKELTEEFAVGDNSEELKVLQKSIEDLPDKIAAGVAEALKVSRKIEDETDEEKVKREKAEKAKRSKAKRKKDKEKDDDEDDDDEDEDDEDDDDGGETNPVVRALNKLSSRLDGLPMRRGLEGPTDDDLEITKKDTGKTAKRKVVERLKRSEDYKNDDPAGRLSRLVDLETSISGDPFDEDDDEEETETDE